MDVLIREMCSDDIQAVQKIAESSWHATYEGIIPEPIQDQFLNMAYSSESLEKRLNNSIFLVAEHYGKEIGFANFVDLKEGKESELAAMYLLPANQKQGIGTLLLQEGVSRLNRSMKLFADVEKENHTGLAFYKAKGFQELSEFEDNLFGYAFKTKRLMLPL